MQKGDSIRLPVVLYEILLQHTDQKHVITMKEIMKYLQDDGIQCDRRTVYNARDVLTDHHIPIVQTRINGVQGYYLKHIFSASEALILLDLIAESSSLSEKESRKLSDKITGLMSEWEKAALPEIFMSPSKTDNHSVPENIAILMNAIADRHRVRFLYYDTVVTDDAKPGRHYRRNKKLYEIDPYGIVSESGRFYCISYNQKYQNQTIYRIDKILNMEETDEQFTPVYFDMQDYVRRSVQMYGGNSQSVTAVFSRKIASNVFDEFGNSRKSIIIERVSEDSFQATIRTSLTPTVTGWFLQFYQDATVISPQEFKDTLLNIAGTIEKNYNEHKKQEDSR